MIDEIRKGASEKEESASVAPADIEETRRFRILVVDDEFLIRYMIPKALNPLGVYVDVAEDGLQAQGKILAGNFDLIITDINMPEMDGWELLSWVKENRPQIEGIVMTGFDIAETMSKELPENAKDFLAKPFPTEQLLEAVRRSMERLKCR